MALKNGLSEFSQRSNSKFRIFMIILVEAGISQSRHYVASVMVYSEHEFPSTKRMNLSTHTSNMNRARHETSYSAR